ncbi:hypothetical protein Q9L42_016930 [Methylomarinum sp. Ch1-1]|uniref:Uncharacterized protein n=1 Tax=Methylomarinum roseum TaxID=3067653 RepID=A0AAU7NSR6_9GAMM|nr:hypothetical protein [Methylomarinum sp. Ch1-1]MDP4519989.1 hypothetical protein [Methylomarinum sp. Ch1-1]
MTTLAIDGKVYSEQDIVQEKQEYIRLEAVDACFALHALVNDKSALVRSAVARKKVGHEYLVFDKNWRVRATVAQYCDDEHLLDQLKNDSNEFVRFIVAKRGYALEQFVDDVDEEIASLARYQLQNRWVAA